MDGFTPAIVPATDGFRDYFNEARERLRRCAQIATKGPRLSLGSPCEAATPRAAWFPQASQRRRVPTSGVHGFDLAGRFSKRSLGFPCVPPARARGGGAEQSDGAVDGLGFLQGFDWRCAPVEPATPRPAFRPPRSPPPPVAAAERVPHGDSTAATRQCAHGCALLAMVPRGRGACPCWRPCRRSLALRRQARARGCSGEGGPQAAV